MATNTRAPTDTGAGATIPGCTGELASVVVNVYNGPLLSAENLRGRVVKRSTGIGEFLTCHLTGASLRAARL